MVLHTTSIKHDYDFIKQPNVYIINYSTRG